MASVFVINNLTWWMSNDRFFWSKWQAYFLENVDISEQRYVKLDTKSIQINSLGTYNETILAMKETPQWVVQCGYTKVWMGGWDKTGTVAWAYAFEYFGDVLGQQKNVFIQNATCITTNSDITSVIWSVWFTAGTGYWVWSSTSVYGKVLFSNDNIIYEYDPATPTTAPVNKNDKIPFGSKIIHLYFYNDILYVVTRKYHDTIIYSMQYVNNAGTTSYSIYNVDNNIWYTCLWAVWNWNSIYWVTPNYIMQYSGWYSQQVSTFWWSSYVNINWFISSPQLTYSTGFLYVSNGSTIYRYWSNKPWRSSYLTSFQAPTTVSAMTANYIHWLVWTDNRLYVLGSSYQTTGTIITLPYDAGVYWDSKSELKFRIWYQLPINTYSGTQCSITVAIMTDYMELNNTVNTVTVATITDKTKQRQYVLVSEINTALSNAWYSNDWQYIRFKITLNWGNESSGNMTRTPIFYDIKAIHNTIKDELE